MMDNTSEVFKDELVCITDVEAKFQIDDSVEPRFRDRMNDEQSRLKREGCWRELILQISHVKLCLL